MAQKPTEERLEFKMLKRLKDQMRVISTKRGITLKAFAIECIMSGVKKNKKLLEES